MNRNVAILRDNLFIIIVGVYWILGISLLGYFQYNLNSDNFFFIDIAAKYASGSFNNAINGYWSPLISWLLTPLMIMNPNAYNVDFKILSLFIGFLNLLGIRLLSYRFEMDDKTRNMLIISIIPLILSLSLVYNSSPDLLVACILTFYLYVIFDPDYPNKLSNGFLCGILGALAYFSKTYAFPFFLVHFTLFNLIHYFNGFKKLRRKTLTNLFIGIVIFLSICGLWVGVISDKYGEMTIGTTSQYNYDKFGPNQVDTIYQGLAEPWNPDLISAWEDSSYFKLNGWGSLDSYDSFVYQLKLIYKNIVETIQDFESFSVFSLLILLIALLFTVKTYSTFLKDIVFYTFLTITIYTAGYLIIFVSFRYLIIDYFLILMLFGYLITKIRNLPRIKFNQVLLIRTFFILMFSISLIIFPVMSLINGVDGGKELYDVGQILKNDYNITGNIASNGYGGEWESTLYLSYYLNGKYYGLTNENSTDKLTKELKDNNIDYYFYWNVQGDNLRLPYKDVTGNRFAYLKVYSIKD